MENKRGLFIVIEGVDGSGKTTQANLLAEYLRSKGRTIHHTAEPTATGLGGMVRDGLGGEHPRTREELAAMFAADRVQHNVSPKNGIIKHLSEGTDVVCDRYYYSSMAYQGSETDAAWVRDMNLNCPEILHPDLCIFLDLTPAQSMERITRGRATQEIYETEERLTLVRDQFYRVFSELSSCENVQIVNAYRSIEEIHTQIVALVNA